MAEFRWAILGTGSVARKFLLGLRAAEGHRCVAVASRDPENAARFARRFGCAAEDYAGAVARADVDAVYVATPPGLHEAHALLAIAAGKPVLVEKPFAPDAAAAARIRDAAQGAGLFCMEALWTRFLPLTERLCAMVAEGALGQPRSFHASFGIADIPDRVSSLYDPARGGGALMHRGYYGVALARAFLGPVAGVRATARIGDTGVDEDVALILTHENGALSSVEASLRSAARNAVSLRGTDGRIEVSAPLYRPVEARFFPTRARKAGTGGPPGRGEALKEGGLVQGLHQRLAPWAARLRPGGRRIAAPHAGNGYGHEALALARAVRAGLTEEPRHTLADSVAVIDLLDRARAQFED